MKLELKPFTELIDAAVPPTRASLRWALPAAAPLALLGVIMVVAQTAMYEQMTGGALDGSQLGSAFAGIGISMFALLAWTLLASTSLAAAAIDRLQGIETGFFAGLRWTLTPRVLGTLLLTAAAMVISIMACFVPFVLLAPLFGLVVPVMRLEKRYLVDAIRRSWQLVWFNNSGRMADSGWLFMFGIMFVGWMLSFGLSAAVNLPVMSYQQFITFDKAFSGEVADPGAIMREMRNANMVVQVVGAMAQTVSWTFLGYACGLFYFEARRRREAYDLEAAIERLPGSEAEPA